MRLVLVLLLIGWKTGTIFFSKSLRARSSIQNKRNWNNASKRLFGRYSHSGIPGFPFRQFCFLAGAESPAYIPEYPKRTRPKHSNRNRVITFDTYLETALLGYQETRRSCRRQDGVKLSILVRALNWRKIIQIQLMLQQRPNDIYCKTSKDYT